MDDRYNKKYLSPFHQPPTEMIDRQQHHRPPPDPFPLAPTSRTTTRILQPLSVESPITMSNDRRRIVNKDRDRNQSSSGRRAEKNIWCWSALKRRVREFSEETVMQGLGQMLSEELPWITRIAWFAVFAVAAITCVTLVGSSFERYFSYEVSTTTSLETLSEVDFPAITFCNENMLKKSMVRYSPILVTSLTALTFGVIDEIAQTNGDDEWRTCARNVSDPRNDGKRRRQLHDYEQFRTSDEAYAYFRRIGMNRAMSMFALDSNASVLDCWWKDHDIDCGKLFLNHITDYGWCFTMNPGEYLLLGYRGLGLKQNDTAYGINRQGYRQLKLQSTGPYNGFRVLLHCHQEEYCVTRSHGAGFNILIHDADVQPLFFLERPISLSPGYETNVAIKFTKMTKETESLGQCVEYVYLNLYPHAVKYYRQACYMQCFTDYVYSRCNCTPLYGPPRSNYLKKDLDNLDYTPVGCWREDLIKCMKKHEKHFLNNDLDLLCVKCRPPCHEVHYDFQVSSTYFPAENSRAAYEKYASTSKRNSSTTTGGDEDGDGLDDEDFVEDFDTDEEHGLKMDYLRSNLVSANFFVESMQVHVITETQATTLEELVGDFGAHIGFFLGLSVISVFEMAQCLCLPRNVPSDDRKGRNSLGGRGPKW